MRSLKTVLAKPNIEEAPDFPLAVGTKILVAIDNFTFREAIIVSSIYTREREYYILFEPLNFYDILKDISHDDIVTIFS